LSGTNPRTTVDKELDELLYTAIQTKHLVRFKYKGQERVAEPHDYGIQKGIVRLFCYQLTRRFAGSRRDSSSKHHEWDEVFIRVE
jgi:hypothetical protein